MKQLNKLAWGDAEETWFREKRRLQKYICGAMVYLPTKV